jgi:serine protease Do
MTMDRGRPIDIGAAASEILERLAASVVEIRPPQGGTGAGVVWRPDGTIITNHHVARAERAEVGLADGRRFSATVVARDTRNDLATLKAPGQELPAATIGDARTLRVGELVLAVGHPFGIRSSLTVGVVSGALPQRAAASHGRLRAPLRELIRADVLLGPGNSGGPLLNARGQVVGINAMVMGGLALAVPSHLVERLLADANGRQWFGIEVIQVELPPTFGAYSRGALLTKVAAGSAAEAAGLLVGDVLLALDDAPLLDLDSLRDALAAKSDTPPRVRILRGGTEQQVTLSSAWGRQAA